MGLLGDMDQCTLRITCSVRSIRKHVHRSVRHMIRLRIDLTRRSSMNWPSSRTIDNSRPERHWDRDATVECGTKLDLVNRPTNPHDVAGSAGAWRSVPLFVGKLVSVLPHTCTHNIRVATWWSPCDHRYVIVSWPLYKFPRLQEDNNIDIHGLTWAQFGPFYGHTQQTVTWWHSDENGDHKDRDIGPYNGLKINGRLSNGQVPSIYNVVKHHQLKTSGVPHLTLKYAQKELSN